MNAVPTAAHVEHYAHIVERCATLRRLIQAGSEIVRLAYQEDADVIQALDKAEQLVFAVAERRSGRDFILLRDALREYFDQLDTLHAHRGQLLGLPTGFHDLDELLGGLHKSDLVIVAGRPSAGKTSFATGIAQHVAVAAKKPVALFSLEMSSEQLVQRLLCSEANVDSQRLRGGYIDDDEWQRVTEAMGTLSEAPIYIDDSANISVMELRTKARRLKAQHDIAAVFIDYLQLMQGSGKENRVQEVSEISRSLKGLARELDVPGGRAVAAEPRRGVAFAAHTDPLGPARIGLHRAGRRRGDVRAPRGDVQPEHGAQEHRRHHRGQAPQRPDRHGAAALVPGADALRRPGDAGPPRGCPRTRWSRPPGDGAARSKNPRDHCDPGGLVYAAVADFAGCPRSLRKKLADLPVLPDHQERAGNEDGGVGPGDDADQHRQDKVADGDAAEEEERRQREDDGEARVDRAVHGLQDAVVHHALEGLVGILDHVLAHPVKDDDGVVDREADGPGQQRGEEEGVDLDVEEHAQDGKEAHHHQDVVDQGQDGAHAEAERVRHLAECPRDVEQDAQAGQRHGDLGSLRDLLADSGADGLEAQLGVGAQLGPERRVDGGLGVGDRWPCCEPGRPVPCPSPRSGWRRRRCR